MKKADKDTWIVIPGYNEAKRIGDVLKRTKKYAKNIVVVDDGSKDRTFSVAYDQGVTVLKLIVNLGKGAALKAGCDYAIKQGAKQIVMLDSDGQHKPERIPDFLEALKHTDIVFGSRSLDNNMPGLFRFGNNFITKTTELLYKVKLKDTLTGYRAFTADAYKKIRWTSSDYFVESEMIANAGKHNLRYTEIDVATITHDKYKGTTVLTGVKIVMNMLLWRLKWS